MAVEWDDPKTILTHAWADAARECQVSIRDESLNDTLGGDSVLTLLDHLQESISKSAGNPRKVKLLDTFASFAQWLDRYGRCIDTFVQASPEASIIWGSIRVILQFVVTRVNSLSKVVNVFTCILENFGRYELYQSLFVHDRNVQCVLALVYADIITFCAKTAAFYNAKGFRASLKRTAVNFESKYAGTVENFNRHRMLVEDTVRAAGHQREHAASMRKELDKQERKSKALRKWLSPSTRDATYYESDHRAARTLRTPGTCSWLRKSKPFQQWLASDRQTLLLTGNPGHGKTTIISDLIDNISLQVTGSRLAYFYCKYQDTDKRTSLSLVKSLLLQLLDLGNVNQEVWNQLAKLYEISVQDSAQSGDLLGKFCEVLWKTLNNTPQTTFVIVDALNECEDRKLFLEELKTYAKANALRSTKFIMSCRTERDISDILLDIELRSDILPVRRQNTAEDMILYISMEMAADRRMRAWPHSLKDLVQNKLLARADGMFLWTKLMLGQIASQPTLGDVERALEDLPSDLPHTYLRILNGLQRSPYLKRILQWLCMSKRTIKAQELRLILEIDLSDTAYNPKRAILSSLSDILGASCGPLVELQDEEVRFTHFTVKGFLFSERAMSTAFGVKDVEAHNEIAATCLTYLSYRASPNFHEGIFSVVRNNPKTCSRIPIEPGADGTRKNEDDSKDIQTVLPSVPSCDVLLTGCIKDRDAFIETFLATPNTALFDYAIRFFSYHLIYLVHASTLNPIVLEKLRQLLFGRVCLTFIESTILLMGSAGPLVSKLQLADSLGCLGIGPWISGARVLLSEFDNLLRYYPGKIHTLPPKYFAAENPFHDMLLAKPHVILYNTGDVSAIANLPNFGDIAIVDPSRNYFFTVNRRFIECRNLEDGLLLEEFALDVGSGNKRKVAGSSEVVDVRISKDGMYLAMHFESRYQDTPERISETHVLALHQTEGKILTPLSWTKSTEVEVYVLPQRKPKTPLHFTLPDKRNMNFSVDSKVFYGPSVVIDLESGAQFPMPCLSSENISSITFADSAPIFAMVIDGSSISVVTVDGEKLSSISFCTGSLKIKAVSPCGRLVAFLVSPNKSKSHSTNKELLFVYDWKKGYLCELSSWASHNDRGHVSQSGVRNRYPVLFNNRATRLLVTVPNEDYSPTSPRFPLDEPSISIHVILFELSSRIEASPAIQNLQCAEWQKIFSHKLIIPGSMEKRVAVSFSTKLDRPEQVLAMTPHEIQLWTLQGFVKDGLTVRRDDITPYSGIHHAITGHRIKSLTVRTALSSSRGTMALLITTGKMLEESRPAGLAHRFRADHTFQLRIYDIRRRVNLLHDFEVQCAEDTSLFAVNYSGSQLIVGRILIIISDENTYETYPMDEVFQSFRWENTIDEEVESIEPPGLIEPSHKYPSIQDFQFHSNGRFLGFIFRNMTKGLISLCVFDLNLWRPASSWSTQYPIASYLPYFIYAFHPTLPKVVWAVEGLQVAICDFASNEAPRVLPFTCHQPFPQHYPHSIDFKLKPLAFSTCGQYLMYRDVRRAGMRLFSLREDSRMHSTDFLPKDDAWSHHCTFSSARGEGGDDNASVFITTPGSHGELFVSQRDLVRRRDRRAVLAGLPKSLAPEPSLSGTGIVGSKVTNELNLIICKDYPAMQPVILSYANIPWTAWEESPDAALQNSGPASLEGRGTKTAAAPLETIESQRNEPLRRGLRRLSWELKAYKTFVQDPKWLEVAREGSSKPFHACTYDDRGFPSPELLNVITKSTTAVALWSEQVGQRFEHTWQWKVRQPGFEPLSGDWKGYISQASRHRVNQFMSGDEMTPPFFTWSSLSGYKGTLGNLEELEAGQ